MGETCGLKMVYSTTPTRSMCRICQAINIKERKLKKAIEDYQRFQPDPQRQATASVRYQEILELQRTVKELQDERVSRMNKVGNSHRRKTGTALQQMPYKKRRVRVNGYVRRTSGSEIWLEIQAEENR